VDLACAAYALNQESVPSLNVSASRQEDGRIFVTLCHLNPHYGVEINVTVEGADTRKVTGQVLTAPAMNAFNTFDDASIVVPRPLERLTVEKNRIRLVLPAMSVTAMRIQ
jgi:alpha-N-arabinofuranosidase